MLEGTEREVLELLLERPRSPTEIADELGVSVQTASRNLKQLVEREFAERTRDGGGRGYKQYRAKEFAQVFAGYDGKLFERTLPLSVEERAILSVLTIPQTEFHPALLSHLFAPDFDRIELGIVGMVVYGSVARGEAGADSDIDLLMIYENDEFDAEVNLFGTTISTGESLMNPDGNRVVSETWFTVSEFHDALDAGSQFLGNVLDEGISLYDPEGVIRDAKRERAGERVPQ